ncbi:YwmB family TATA-box binding protein [Lutibacter sp. B2]|nr:YwmB family TATA-box binding protein [Lutibacter sp. B2]
MKRNYLFVLIILILGLTYNTNAVNNKNSTDIFNLTDAELEEININAYVDIADRYITSNEATGIINKIGKKLKITNLHSEDHSNDGNTQMVSNGKIKENQNIVIIVQSTNTEDIKESNIVIDLTTQNKMQISKWKEDVKAVLKAYGKAEFNVCITGSYDKKLSNAEEKRKLEKVTKSFAVKKIESFEDKDFLSITGYTNNFNNWIAYNGKKVNINIAMRYNNYKKKTYVWIGNPLISIGY